MKTQQAKRSNRIRMPAIAIALVAILVASALPMVPVAKAAVVDFDIEPTSTTAGRDQTMTFRKVEVSNDRSSGNIREVSFQVPELGSIPKKSIEWEKSVSKAQGWVVTVDNSKNPNVLKFTSQGSGIQPGQSRSFNIGFSVAGNPDPAKDPAFTVSVYALYVGETNPVGPEQYTIQVDDSPPTILPTGAITLDLRDGTSLKPNGKIDHMYLVFSEPMEPSTLRVDDFRIGAYSITEMVFDAGTISSIGSLDPSTLPTCNKYQLVQCKPSFGVCPPESKLGCSRALVKLAEKFEFDSGALPDVTTVAQNLKDVAGNSLQPITSATVTEVDGANPVLVSVLAKDLDDTSPDLEGMRLTFSEKVRGANGLRVTCDDFVFPGPTSAYEDLANPGTTPKGNTQRPVDPLNCGTEWLITHPPGDAAPQDTHLMEIQFSAPAQGLNNQDVQADSLGCPNLIRDLSSSGAGGKGLPCMNQFSTNPETGASYNVVPTRIFVPDIREAEVNIDSFKITVEFNVPVSDATGDTVRVKAESFDIVPTDGGGPQGIDRIEHEPCSHIVVVHTDKPIKPTDVDKTPSFLRVAANTIKGCGSGAAKPLYVPAQDEPLRDATFPAILAAHTVDEDKNGIIDGFFLEFNEPVDDARFCDGKMFCPHSSLDCTLPAMPTPVPDDYYQFLPNRPSVCDTTPGLTAGYVGLADPGGLLGLSASCFPFFEFDTDRAVNDRFAIIKWVEPKGTCYERDPGVDRNDEDGDGSVIDPRPVGPPPHLDTGYVPHLLVNANAIFDLAQSPNQNPLKAADRLSLVETDGAAPVILTAHTTDRETRFRDEPTLKGTPCIVGEENLCEEDPDGYIDGYRVIFSEDVKDASFVASEWNVKDHTVTGLQRDSLAGDETNDERIIVAFEEGVHPDGNKSAPKVLEHNTDKKPALTYYQKPVGGKALGTFTDLAGNKLEPVNDFKVRERDGARPVIVHAEAFVNQTTVRVTFSEPVDDGVGEALIRSDFVYSNRNSPTIGASPEELAALNDRTTGFDNTKPVVHEAGGEVAVLHVNRPFTQQDIDADHLGANAVSVREGTQSVIDKQYALTTFKPLKFDTDVTDPGPVKNLALDVAKANTVTLRWVAPGDDGDKNDAVAGYVIKISNEEFEYFNDTEIFDEIGGKLVLPEGGPRNVVTPGTIPPSRNLTFEYTPFDMAGPGALQRVRICCLDAAQTYYVAVRAYENDVDENGLPRVSDWNGRMVEVETLDDETPPTGTYVLRSTTHPASTPVLAKTAVFFWDNLQDPESDVVYHYKITNKPGATVTQADKSTTDTTISIELPGEGSYWFTVRGFTAGGAHPDQGVYNAVVGNQEIDPISIRDYNLKVRKSIDVTWEADGNRISWELPDSSDVGDLEAIRVWRIEEGIYQQIGTVNGDYDDLKEGSYLDEDGLESSSYTIDAQFASGQTAGDPSIATLSPKGVDGIPEKGTPGWVWAILAIALVLVIGGIVAIIIVRSRHVPAELESGPTIDPETGLPSHSVRCPSCTHQFQAVGEPPLEIECPECQTRGVLE